MGCGIQYFVPQAKEEQLPCTESGIYFTVDAVLDNRRELCERLGIQMCIRDSSQSLWQQIATYFKDYDEHLIFEGFNEIDNIEKSWNYSALAADQMNRMNQIFVTTVRQTGGNNASRILLVPTLLDGTSADILQAFVLPQDTISNRLIVQVHFYTKKYNQDIESDFAQLEAFSDRIGAPVVIGEFGTTSSYPAAGIRARRCV